MGGDGTRRVPLMATSELNDSLKRDVLCRLKTLQNFDRNIPKILIWLVFPSRYVGKIDVGAELRLLSIRDNPLPGRSENCQASWLCQKLMHSGKKILGLPVSIGLDWEEYGCSKRCCKKSGKSTLLDLWSHFNISADFDIFPQNQHCWIQIVIGALAGPREAWSILWIRLKSKLDGFGNSGIFCQNRKNPLKLCSGSWLGSV